MIDFESKLTVQFPGLARDTQNVLEWRIDSAYLTSTDGFQFTLYEEDRTLLRGLELQPVELLVAGAFQLIGRIDRTRVGHDGHAVECSGRDYIADLVECNVDPTMKLKLGDKLDTAILMAASPVGIDVVISDDDITMGTVRSGKKVRRSGGGGRGKSRLGKAVQDFKPQPGEGIYEFLNKIVARAGGTIQPGTARNELLIEEPLYDADPLYRLARTDDVANGVHNNIVDAVADRDFSRFPTYVLINGTQARGGDRGANASFDYDVWGIAAGFRSELGRILQDGSVSDRWKPGKVADQVKDGSLYRLFVHRDEPARDAEQVEMAARRALAERLKDTLEYTVMLKGHTDPDSGAVWSVNTIVQVDDDIADIHEPLWIAERTLSYAPREGARTQLRCWRPESFELTEKAAANAGGKGQIGGMQSAAFAESQRNTTATGETATRPDQLKTSGI